MILFNIDQTLSRYGEAGSTIASPRSIGQVSFALQLRTLQAILPRNTGIPPDC